MRIFFAIALFILSQVPARAEESNFITSSMPTWAVIETCRKAGDVNRIDCSGYILGVFDAASYAGLICPPTLQGATAQALAVALKYLNDHPQEWHHNPGQLIAQGFKAAFPCRKN